MEHERDGRYKVRLVAGGHRQQDGLNFEETYSLVCSYRTMRMIMAVSAREGLAMRQFDIRTAFLNCELEEEVYMRPPAGAEGLPGRGKQGAASQEVALRAASCVSCLEQAPRR
jgi:hypothetical protein